MHADTASEVLASECREEVLRTLSKGNATKEQLVEELDWHRNTISDALTRLLEMDLIVQLTDGERRKGTIYATNESGEETIQWLKEECL